MRIGIAFDLKSDFAPTAGGPEDRLEEYDSEETVAAIAQALAALGHQPVRLGGGRRFVEAVLRAAPELVFNIAEGHGTRSREAHVPAVCEMLGIPVTHSDPLTLALSLDKAMAKRVAAAQGVPTPRFSVIEDEAALDAIDLRFPVVAKPLAEGSSMGVRLHSRAATPEALRALVRPLLQGYAQPVLVEEFCAGPEFTVGVLGTGRDARSIGVMEIVPRRTDPEHFLYSLEVKRNYAEEVEYHVPPRRPEAVVRGVAEVALAAHRALGCRDVCRVDVRMDAHGVPMFLELNPLPGINPVTGDIVILATRSGLPYQDLIGAIVREALARHGRAAP